MGMNSDYASSNPGDIGYDKRPTKVIDFHQDSLVRTIEIPMSTILLLEPEGKDDLERTIQSIRRGPSTPCEPSPELLQRGASRPPPPPESDPQHPTPGEEKA